MRMAVKRASASVARAVAASRSAIEHAPCGGCGARSGVLAYFARERVGASGVGVAL